MSMSKEAVLPELIVMVRHGKSEGQDAAERAKNGDLSAFTEAYRNTPSKDWGITEEGVQQTGRAGPWLARFIVSRLAYIGTPSIATHYGPDHPSHPTRGFAMGRVSPLRRAIETAGVLSQYVHVEGGWRPDINLSEQNFGDISTMPHKEYKNKYEDNAVVRKADKLYWRPPGGNSVGDLVGTQQDLLGTMTRRYKRGTNSIITVGSGRQMAAMQMLLEGINPAEWPDFISRSENEIDNLQVVAYNRRNPETGQLHYAHRWRLSVCPWKNPDDPGKWVEFDPEASRLSPEQCTATINPDWLAKLPPPTFPV